MFGLCIDHGTAAVCPVGGLPTRQLIMATRPLWSQVRELFQDPRRFAAELSDSTSTLYVQRGWLPEGGKDNDFDVVQLQLTTRARAGVENCTKTGSQRRTTDSTISWGGLFRPPLVNSKEVFAVGRGSTGETAQKNRNDMSSGEYVECLRFIG